MVVELTYSNSILISQLASCNDLLAQMFPRKLKVLDHDTWNNESNTMLATSNYGSYLNKLYSLLEE